MSNDSFETDVRAMLADRAGDVDTLPASVFAFEDDRPSDADGLTDAPLAVHRRRTSPLLAVAATVVAVLAAAGIVVAAQSSDDRNETPPVDGMPSVTAPPTTVTASAALSWFGIRQPSGYEFGERTSRPGYETLAMTKVGDDGAIRGPDHGSPFQTYVTVWNSTRFNGSAAVAKWRPIDVPGRRTAYRGKLGLAGGNGYRYDTVAFKSARGHWVLVQGRTAAASTTAQLRTVAGSIRPDETVAAPVPFRLRYVPPGSRVLSVYEDLRVGHTLMRVTLLAPAGQVEITVAGSVTGTGVGTVDPQEKRSVAGVPVDIDFGRAVGVARLGDKTAVAIKVSRRGREPIAEQRYQLDRMLKNITWRDAQGESGLPLTQAIP